MTHERLRLELRRARRPFAVYVVALAVASAVLAVMVTSQRFDSPFTDTYRFRAVVDDVKGVVPGKNPVRIAGVEVGLITAADLERGRPVVEISIRREFAPVFRDARVRVRPLTAVQDMYASLERGHRSAGRLPEGGLIGAEQTVSAVDISR
ncbi:MAG TPA: MlaD family protein, partial [Baekduia sp.]|nr:MlaD family protein [Baekduia sp.]